MVDSIIQLGLIGVGASWESGYRLAVDAMRSRLAIRSVHDPVYSFADRTAKSIGPSCSAVGGIRQMLEDPQLDGLVCLDTGWMGIELVEWLTSQSKPVYLGGGFGDRVELIDSTAKGLQQHGWMCMPEFRRRFTPATTRLQELIATDLGRLQRMTVPVSSDIVSGAIASTNGALDQSAFDELVGWLDWGKWLMHCEPVAIRPASAAGTVFSLDFPTVPNADVPATIDFVQIDKSEEGTAECESPPLQIVTGNGTATIQSDACLSWSVDEDSCEEDLSSDRSSYQVMLDLFCRRIIGGLLPTPGLDDVARSIQLALDIRQAVTTGQVVSLHPG